MDKEVLTKELVSQENKYKVKKCKVMKYNPHSGVVVFLLSGNEVQATVAKKLPVDIKYLEISYIENQDGNLVVKI